MTPTHCPCSPPPAQVRLTSSPLELHSVVLDLVSSLFCFSLFPLLLMNLINVCTVKLCAVCWKETRAAIAGALQRKDRTCSFHHSLYWRWIARVKDLFSLLLSVSLLISLTPSLSTDVVKLLPVVSRPFSHVERTNMSEMFNIWIILFCWEIKRSCFSAPFSFSSVNNIRKTM